MKTINKILTLLFISSLFLGLITTACTEEIKYDPAEQLTNAQVYFSNTLPSKINLPQDMNVSSYDIELHRIIKTDALTVNLTVENENSDLLTIPTSASFATGADVAKITIKYDPEKLGYDNFKPVSITVSDKSLTSPYGNFVYNFTIGIPAPWKSLGKATFSDAFMFDESYEIELQQNEIDPTRFRLVDPYTQGLIKEEYYPDNCLGNQSPYFEFQVLPQGSVYRGITIPTEGMVVYDAVCTGYYRSDYGADVYVLHPSDPLRPATNDVSFWMKNIVTRFSADGNPEVVQIAPWYYMYGVGGWNYTQYDGMITIIFPGVVLVDYDYSISLSYLGHYIDVNDVDNAIVKITKGADAVSYKYAVVDGVLSASAAAEVTNEIIAGTIATEEDTQNGYKIFPFEKAGKYSVVAVTFDEDGEPQDFSYISFEFIPAGMKNPWISLGFCEYTDDVLASLFGAPVPTYEVEILEHQDKPGLFRLKNAYGADYPYNDPGDYEERDIYIEINATDPDGVYIDFQSMGVDWGYGTMFIYSFASYYMDYGYTLEDAKDDGVCGTYKDDIITFPVDALIIADDDDMYLANPDGLWKVDMTSLISKISKSKVASKGISSKNGLARSSSHAKAPLKLKSNMPVRVKGKNVPESVIRKNIRTVSPLVR